MMGDAEGLPRRTIEELITRYTLEPNLRDLYVEGTLDQTVYGWYLRSISRADVSVFEITSVDVNSQILESYGLSSGHRNRVIALALEIDKEFPTVLSHVRCIVDSDFDFILASQIAASHLMYTDYTSIEMYTYNKILLSKLLLLGFNIPESEFKPLCSSMSLVLKELFVIRASNEALGWSMSLVPFTRCCNVAGSTIVLQKTDFIERCLNSASRMRDRHQFESVYENLLGVKLDDLKKGVHGEDYLELLGWYLHNHCGWQGYRRGERSILRNLLPMLDAEALSKETLFSQLCEVYHAVSA